MITALSHVMVFAADPIAATRWYESHLGFVGRYASRHYATLDHPSGVGLHIHGAEADSPDISRGAQPYFAVADIDAAVSMLRAAGITVTDPRSEEGSPRFAMLDDPEGNTIGLSEVR